MANLIRLIAIVSMTIVIGRLAATQRVLSNLEELYEAGKTLESAQNQLAAEAEQQAGGAGMGRNKLLFLFVREPKSNACDRFQGQVTEVADQFRIKALNFIVDSQKQQGWFGSLMRTVGPLNALRSVSKSFPYLREATERYAQHAKVDAVSEQDVECDLVKFQIESLDRILFVLATDIKYLATEPSALVNTAIFRQLQEAKFVANHNFYSIKELTANQRQLLKNFYLDRVDQDAVTVGDAVDHFEEPTSLVLGRLHDSCHALLAHTDTWEQLEPRRADSCAKSKLAAKTQLVFPHQLDNYELPIAFCRPFLDSL